ncbi:MAG: DUF512 domain-containing protein [Armatimonadota bacterium]
MPAEVRAVAPGSAAWRAGVRAGDSIVSVNGRKPRDYIHYRYLTTEPRVTLVVAGANGKRRRLAIEKGVDEDLGLSFTTDVFDGVMSCRNRCSFCFVSQLPPGLRPALYVKDDDYRLSFLHGNFITLTNLTPADRRRIAREHLSPLYVSVHATEPDVRRQLFGRATVDPLAEMRRLGAKGIRFHVQVVVCPGVNDGPHLARTVRDLAGLYPAVASIGVVPVGLTRYAAAGIRAVTRPVARGLLAAVGRWQSEFRATLGTRLVFAADELYLLVRGGSSRPLSALLPKRSDYEGFPQLGNGIGCARQFLDSLGRLRAPRLRRSVSVRLVTGEMAAPLVAALAARLRRGDVEARVCVVRNRLFGRSVTTAGLLAGGDIARALGVRARSDLVIVPGTAIRENEGFIDGMTLEQLSDRLGIPVTAASTPGQASAALRQFARGGGSR